MTRIAILAKYAGPDTICRYTDSWSNALVVKDMLERYGPPHQVKRITICAENFVFTNEPSIKTWLENAKKVAK